MGIQKDNLDFRSFSTKTGQDKVSIAIRKSRFQCNDGATAWSRWIREGVKYQVIELEGAYAIALKHRIIISGIETIHDAEQVCAQLNKTNRG
jgi:hypothetical protein